MAVARGVVEFRGLPEGATPWACGLWVRIFRPKHGPVQV